MALLRLLVAHRATPRVQKPVPAATLKPSVPCAAGDTRGPDIRQLPAAAHWLCLSFGCSASKALVREGKQAPWAPLLLLLLCGFHCHTSPFAELVSNVQTRLCLLCRWFWGSAAASLTPSPLPRSALGCPWPAHWCHSQWLSGVTSGTRELCGAQGAICPSPGTTCLL